MKLLWSTLRELLPLLPAGARRFFLVYIGMTSALTLIDVAAMALLAVVISAIVTGSSFAIPVIGSLPSSAAPLLILVACILIIVKSALSVFLHWIATRRFARYELQIGQRMFHAYVRSSWEERSKRTVAEVTRIADGGIANTIMGFLLPLALVPGNVLTFVLILAVLVVAQPLTAVIALVYLGIIAIIVNQVVTKRALLAGRVNRDASYRVAIFMTEMVEALKEITLRNKLEQVAGVVTEERKRAVRARANASFLGIIPKYTFEAALVGGFLLIGGAGLLISGPEEAIVSVALFATTGFRLIPAINGVQGGIIQATATLPSAQDVIGDITRTERDVAANDTSRDVQELPAEPTLLRLESVRFRYPKSQADVLDGVDIDIPFGSSLGIVGPSGAGKSTLIDLLLGLSTPTGGRLAIDGLPLTDVINQWRGRVGYVPQRVALFDASIAQNVALTWDHDFDEERVVRALEMAQLSGLVAERDAGIHTRIGERGVALSGGQQQRLGIARALYVDPLVLVLDEATSSLDTKTEDGVTRAIRGLHGETTVISVAHRLSTVKDYDRICYLADGQVQGLDTFYRLAETLPAFGEQVALAGLARGPEGRIA
ncbi:ABC transporter ATP-binding protein/permease [Agromyces atrinae]|uniref:ABC transporter ATP-binding protein n=1 Tax=Agromyces atrinae TaxID=592376 RepID=A0A4Q2ME46_9MICO|nr:ABC transporter ATP-binding protein [Agromyces atrinae]MCI2957998.1 ABC transporter ATP-binding protein/permease [Agromyces atrinae]NYD66697.1 ABC-type multidrug transport system fused ATPase/permease subunit [Agromyces atrinae]RXZ87360.1 ABC transporter ATP-binding protein [Agromyces atrinae]